RNVALGDEVIRGHHAREPKATWTAPYVRWLEELEFMRERRDEEATGVPSFWIPWGAAQPKRLWDERAWMLVYHDDHFLFVSVFSFLSLARSAGGRAQLWNTPKKPRDSSTSPPKPVVARTPRPQPPALHEPAHAPPHPAEPRSPLTPGAPTSTTPKPS